MKIIKFLPSMASLNRLAAVYIASNSRSYALYFRCAEFKGLVKKPNGCQVSFARCCNAAPIAKSDASTARLMGAPGIGCANIVALARARFDSLKLVLASSDQIMGMLPFFAPYSKSLRGCKILAAPGMKRR